MIHVIKRDGMRQPVSFDEILQRIESLAEGLDTTYIKPIEVCKRFVDGLYEWGHHRAAWPIGGWNSGFDVETEQN